MGLNEYIDKKHIVSGVVLAAILAAAGALGSWIFPVFGALVRSTVDAVAHALGLFTTFVWGHWPLLLAAMIGALVCYPFAYRHGFREARGLDETEAAAADTAEPGGRQPAVNPGDAAWQEEISGLSAKELQVMRLLGARDGVPVYFQELVREYGWGKIECTNVLQGLFQRELVERGFQTNTLTLTPLGTQFVTDHGMIPTSDK